MAPSRREPPLLDGRDGALIEARPEPLQHPYVGDSTFGRYDHFQEDLAFETRAAPRVGVVRGDFSQQP